MLTVYSVDWKLVSDKAYTAEDNVLIFNIVAFDRFNSNNITIEMARKYFEKFGHVAEFRLVRAELVANRKTADGVDYYYVINFTDATAAARVLKQQYEMNEAHLQFEVTPCFSWCQPTSNDVATDAIATGGASTLLQLNDDCIEHILKQLQGRDQIRFAMVCQQTRTVFEMYSKVAYSKFHTNQLVKWTLCEKREFFTIAGHNISNMTIQFLNNNIENKEYILKCIGKYCCNVTELLISDHTFHCDNYLTKMHKIENLYLDECQLEDSDILTNNKNYNPFRLLRLKKFKLFNYSINKNIKNFLTCLVEHQALHLQYLQIYDEHFYGEISFEESALLACLTQLKELCFVRQNLTDDVRQFEQLEHLEHLCLFECTGFTTSALLSLLQKCRKLCSIDLRWCSNIKEDFVFQAITVLQQRLVPSKRPIQFLVSENSIIRSILNNQQYIDAKSLLEISFDIPSGGNIKKS